jgi:hypothetical protein
VRDPTPRSPGDFRRHDTARGATPEPHLLRAALHLGVQIGAASAVIPARFPFMFRWVRGCHGYPVLIGGAGR